ncbi:MAG: hypothetical protein SPF89_05240 [Sphaerochaetaceae bacterium]|nr:hypothetical protein [Spirochaetales bacterium]MDY5499490.1 hypothetical protein [Sphaerochaetaceae bacterium]
MKRFFSLLVTLMLVSVSAFAEILDFQIGGAALYNVDAESIQDDSDGLLDIGNYNFGLDARLKALVFEGTALFLYNGKTTAAIDGHESERYHETSLLMTGGVAFDMVDTVRLGFGIGPRVRVLSRGGDNYVLADDKLVSSPSFGDMWIHAPFTYRFTCDLLLKPVAIGLSYMIDTDYTIDENDISDLFGVKWRSGKFGLSLLLNW